MPARQGSLHLLPSSSAPATPQGRRRAVDNTKHASEPKLGPGMGLAAAGDSERQGTTSLRFSQTGVPPGQDKSDFQDAQRMGETAEREGPVSRPVEATQMTHCPPDELFSACETMTSRSFVYSQGTKMVGGVNNWTTAYRSITDQACPSTGQQWTTEWKYQVQKITRSRSTDIPCVVWGAGDPQGPVTAEMGDGNCFSPVGPPVSHVSLAVAERTGKENSLTVKPDQTLGFPSSRSKSLHGRPRHAKATQGELDRSGHASSASNLVVMPGIKAEKQKVKQEAASTETEC